jgi:hypothetical protein
VTLAGSCSATPRLQEIEAVLHALVLQFEGRCIALCGLCRDSHASLGRSGVLHVRAGMLRRVLSGSDASWSASGGALRRCWPWPETSASSSKCP